VGVVDHQVQFVLFGETGSKFLHDVIGWAFAASFGKLLELVEQVDRVLAGKLGKNVIVLFAVSITTPAMTDGAELRRPRDLPEVPGSRPVRRFLPLPCFVDLLVSEGGSSVQRGVC
jgi:hypothetical protein